MMQQLKIRTEYSFRTAYGSIESVVDHLKRNGCETAAITDRSSTFGHVSWQKLCKLAGIKPIFGVELAFVPDVTIRTKREKLYWLPLLARSNAGLKEIYSLVEEATNNFYHVPRLGIKQLDAISQDVVILSGNSGIGEFNSVLPDKVLIEGNPATNPTLRGNVIPCSDNYMITPSDREAYEIAIGRLAFNRPSPMHILSAYEVCGNLRLAETIANECNATLSPATNIKSLEDKSLLELCIAGAHNRQINLVGNYLDRMHYELSLIEQKNYTDYFIVIADMVKYAKTQMLVGPARGSSCGSLVCFLLGITDIDPIPHGLIFERFIDITRSDLPDIDIDFDPDHRELVFDYLTTKYGNERVARLGTVSRYKAKSAIGDTALALRIPKWEAEQISDSIIKRGDGDDRANYCITDTFNDTDVGKDMLTRYPKLALAGNLENHARYPGKHAAGVIITNEPITNFVARDNSKNSIQLDKYDCETLNLMKVDALGLRTLSVISDCLDQVGWNKETLLAFALDYDPAYQLLRARLFTGIFQYEGQALQNLTRKIKPDRFTDLVALTALARPGPLISGASYEWCARRNGKEYASDILQEITQETFGLIIYQEQVIRIAREIGGMSWADCTSLRKGMGKSLGIEYMNQYYAKFSTGAKAKFNIDDEKIHSIWEMVNSSGAYSFNKSHSVAYALVSYWCMVLKAKFPLEFALSVLKYASDPDAIKKYLRELDRAGYKFKLYDVEKSQENWSVQGNELIGGLTNIVGIGPKKAEKLLEKGPPYNLPEIVKTPYDNTFEMREKFADLLAHPAKYSIVSKLTEITNIEDEGNYVFIAKVMSYKIRSLNEPKFMVERGGMKVPNDRWLTLFLEDDTDTIPATISRYNFPAFGLPLTKQYKVGEWFLFRGKVMQGNRRVYVEKYKPLK